MTCPRCFADLDAVYPNCPSCGVEFVQKVSGVMKTSAVMIATAGDMGFYRSVQEVPEPLRTRLIETTNSANSGTIVIADRVGKEQITQVVGRRQSAKECAANRAAAAKSSPSWSFLGLPWVFWAGAFLILCAAIVVVAVFAIR
jgi:predicted LPLAT superfamily acyltransferase